MLPTNYSFTNHIYIYIYIYKQNGDDGGTREQKPLEYVMNIVTATGHDRIIMQGARTTMRTGSGGRRLASLRALATVEGSSREGAKVLTQIRKRHAIGRGREGVLPPKRNETQKVSFELLQGRERSPFHVVR